MAALASYALYLIHQPILRKLAQALLAQGVRSVEPVPFFMASLVSSSLDLLVSTSQSD